MDENKSKTPQPNQDIEIADNVFGRISNWGKAIGSIIVLVFLVTVSYLQIDSNSVKIDNHYEHMQKQLIVIEKRIDKKHARQQIYINNLAKKIDRIDIKRFNNVSELNKELEQIRLSHAKLEVCIKTYIEQLKNERK